jgi:hypothetical protein
MKTSKSTGKSQRTVEGRHHRDHEERTRQKRSHTFICHNHWVALHSQVRCPSDIEALGRGADEITGGSNDDTFPSRYWIGGPLFYDEEYVEKEEADSRLKGDMKLAAEREC